MRIRGASAVGVALAALALGACGAGAKGTSTSSAVSSTSEKGTRAILPQTSSWAADPQDVYADDGPGDLSPIVRHDRPLVYVPNSESNTVDEIDPNSYKIVREFAVGAPPKKSIS